MTQRARELEALVGAVIVPQVRVGGTLRGPDVVVPSADYLERFPPRGLIAFGRTPTGAVSPTPLLRAVREVLERAERPRPFVACDLEQGAGLHFLEGTRLPPALALAAAEAGGRARALIDAGEFVGREARELEVDLVLAPVCDVNTTRDNPIIAVRSFGADPRLVGERAARFFEGLRRGGVGACAKHFPGHGDTRADSHLELARVSKNRSALNETELLPFARLVKAGVEALMVAHLDVPALTEESGVPTSLSKRAITQVLRGELEFRGVVLSDALDMGALEGQPDVALRALEAGCDGLLCPRDPGATAEELLRAVGSRRLPIERLRDAAQRMDELAILVEARRAVEPDRSWLGRPAVPLADSPPDRRRRFASELALASLCVSCSPWPWRLGRACEVLSPMPEGIGHEARSLLVELRTSLVDPAGTRSALIPVVGEASAGLGRAGPDARELQAIERRGLDLVRMGWKVCLGWFASPQLIPAHWWGRRELPIVCAFAPSPPMVRAVGEFLLGRGRAGGSPPIPIG